MPLIGQGMHCRERSHHKQIPTDEERQEIGERLWRRRTRKKKDGKRTYQDDHSITSTRKASMQAAR